MIVDQSYFHEALRDPAAPIPAGLVDPQGDPAGRRFNVYRNNVTTSLMDALEDGYPVIKKLLGNENFRNLSREYQAAHPPTSPLMMFFRRAVCRFPRRVQTACQVPLPWRRGATGIRAETGLPRSGYDAD